MVTADSLIQMIAEAFKDRLRPCDDDITHCSYDTKYGGSYEGPCWECEQMAEYFRGRSWRDLSAEELRVNGQADCLFTVEAYCYFLPAYLIAAVRNPDELDVCVGRLAYRFGAERTEEYRAHRLDLILNQLSDREVEAVLAYFVFAREELYSDCPFCERAIENLQRELSQRAKGRKQPAG